MDIFGEAKREGPCFNNIGSSCDTSAGRAFHLSILRQRKEPPDILVTRMSGGSSSM